MNIKRQSQEELEREVEELVSRAQSNHRLGESYIIESNAKLIHSNARVEGSIQNLIKQLKAFNEQSDKQTRKMVSLTWVIAGLTALMFAGLVVQIVISLR